jgi:hypothetical protein
MNGIEFYNVLRAPLNTGDRVGNSRDYKFIKWMRNGGLQFRINAEQAKTIPAELIVMAYRARERGVSIDVQWV